MFGSSTVRLFAWEGTTERPKRPGWKLPNVVERVLDRVAHLMLAQPRVEPTLILRLQKYKRLEAVPTPVKQAAQAAAVLAGSLVEPQGRLLRTPVSRVESDTALLGGGIRFHSRSLVRLLQGATEAYLFLLTLGPRLETRARELMAEEQFLEGLLLDTAGWVAVDALAKTLRAQLSVEAKAEGMRLTHRMAPGYSDWRLEEQRLLFSAFGEEALPIQLTEACVMLPQKSISGIYGLIPSTSAL